MFLIECPSCGTRDASEFHWHGEVSVRPEKGADLSDREWAAYLYDWDNPCGQVREWWFHERGCHEWFILERNTRTHQVGSTE